ncbi:MAG: hypothetical protein ACREXY_19365 [Gammaproteobacteria bacterium]
MMAFEKDVRVRARGEDKVYTVVQAIGNAVLVVDPDTTQYLFFFTELKLVDD